MNRFAVPFFSAAVIIIFLVASAMVTPSAPPPTAKAESLPTVGSYENLKKLLARNQDFRSGMDRGKSKGFAIADFSIASTPESVAKSPVRETKAMDAGAAYSETNVQVRGVDEADVVKTDGKYIYQVNNRRIIVASAYPADEMRVVSSLNFADENFTPLELYIDEKHLVVIGQTFRSIPAPEPAPQGSGAQEPASRGTAEGSGPAGTLDRAQIEIYPPVQHENIVKTIIYDISDRADIKRLRETELSGRYVSSRKIGSALYLAANKNVDYYRIMEGKAEPPTPFYQDTAGKGKPTRIGYPDIRYFPDSVEPNYLMVAGLNLDRPDKQMQVAAYLGAGQNIYASPNNLYVAVSQYPNAATGIYKFALEQGQTEYKGKGEVPGAILNQFSMNEYKGYFRIATTMGEVWRRGENTSKNNLYVLDQALKVAGRIEDIAPGERIYSVRFMGDRAYMVTFKKVDPLFVIDLKDPKAPKILGALKIPGYSDYLHPYDENHIIGFGKDTVEKGSMAYYQGMKLAVFDVSDVAHPKEKFKEIIGGRDTESELLHNHKALLFDREKNLLAFPVTVMETEKVPGRDEIPYGAFTFQGAYVYNIDLIDGFKLKGKITHLTPEEYSKAGQGWYESSRNINRVLYIGDTLYTLSGGMIKANDLNSLKEKNSLSITD